MDFGKVMAITLLVFSVLTLTFNFLKKPFYIPGDIYIDKVGIKFYIPILSTLIISVVIIILLNSFGK